MGRFRRTEKAWLELLTFLFHPEDPQRQAVLNETEYVCFGNRSAPLEQVLCALENLLSMGGLVPDEVLFEKVTTLARLWIAERYNVTDDPLLSELPIFPIESKVAYNFITTRLEQRRRFRLPPLDEDIAQVLPDGSLPLVGPVKELPYESLKVWFGSTDRDLTDEWALGDPEARIALGVCDVSIPASHKFARHERPKWWRLEFREDPRKHIMVQSTTVLDDMAFRQELAEIRASAALVFIHGYNTSLNAAARQAAQICYDLRFPGAPVVFSWGSAGRGTAYLVDSATVDGSVRELALFLWWLRTNTDLKTIHILAHSMGGRLLVRAIMEYPLASHRVAELVVAAPDLDQREFKDSAPRLVRSAKRVSLYASDSDLAIQVSRTIHGYPRAGSGGSDLVLCKGVDSIDCGELPTDFWRHSGHIDSDAVVTDMHGVVINRLPAVARPRLRPVASKPINSWRLDP